MRVLKICNSFSELDFDRLLQVYGYQGEDGYTDSCRLYEYLYEDFFRVKGAFYALWIEDDAYVSALRAEPYEDGYLIEAVQTCQEQRNKGYAKLLLSAVLREACIPKSTPVYAHIHKKNIASQKLHRSCCFEKISDCAAFIDGSVCSHSLTVMYKK